LEENASLLYKTFLEKFDLSLAKSFLQIIPEDSHKHSLLLKSVFESIGKKEKTRKWKNWKSLNPDSRIRSLPPTSL